jgi:asparagine synthase (glutamine-hydrolysing)
MCGIFGEFSSNIHIGMPAGIFLESFIPFIAPRGPDSTGTKQFTFPGSCIVLAHTRLSIIDTTYRASQPMLDESCDWAITYNGEIFNYLEIREELHGLGWLFCTESDTEVLLKAWAQWGVDALPRLNGMFAFAVVHRQTGEMWLVRDRFGVKPLHWARTKHGGVVFSSSVAAVAESIQGEVNTDYCAFGLRYKAFEMPEGQTAFQKVQSLAPGGWMHVRMVDGGVTLEEGRWYDLAQAVASKSDAIAGMADDQLLEQCQHTLQDAVRLRMRSDVPLAVSLSGGLDSSTVAAIAVNMVSDLHGFTYGAADAEKSEGPVVARFTQQTGITPHYIWPELDAAGLDALFERTLTCQEAPFPGLSVMAQNEVFRSVRSAGFKVLLGGQGGDEIFAGYRKFFVVATRRALDSRDLGEAASLLYSLGLMLINEAGAAGMYWRALGRYNNKGDAGFSLLDWVPASANLWGASGVSLVDRQIEDVQRWSIPTLLRYEDRNSMGHGVESRLPFMDYRLVELALALPTRLKIKKGFGKWAVRQITESVVPDFIRLNRKKRGFDVTQSWIDDGLGAILRERIDGNKNALAPYLKAGLNINRNLSNFALKNNENILDEAIMLAWLANPIRKNKIAEIF